jgi:hypothetical protein
MKTNCPTISAFGIDGNGNIDGNIDGNMYAPTLMPPL